MLLKRVPQALTTSDTRARAVAGTPNVTINDITTVVDKHEVTIEDITITVKTTKRFHKTRIEVLLKTWLKRVLNQVRGSF